MKKFGKRTICLVAVLCCLLVSVSACVFAESKNPEVQLTAEIGKAGEEIAVDISVKNNPGIAYIKIEIKYDDCLSIVKAENSGLLTGTFTTSETTDVKPYVLQWMGAENANDNGVMATVTFRIADTTTQREQSIDLRIVECYNQTFEDVVVDDAKTIVTVEPKGCQHINTEILNAQKATCGKDGYTGDTYCRDCGVKLASGRVITATGKHSWNKGVVTTEPTIMTTGLATYTCSVCKTVKTEIIPALKGMMGDVDGNKKLEAADARLTLRAAVGLESLDDNQKTSADVDKNGKVEAADARLILRAAVGLENTSNW